MLRPSPENAGSVSMPALCIRRRGSPPLASMGYNCEPPSRLQVTARGRPSGGHAGALVGPRNGGVSEGADRRAPSRPRVAALRGWSGEKGGWEGGGWQGGPEGRGDDRFGA